MPKVVITYYPNYLEYDVTQVNKDYVPGSDYEVVMDMKASHYRNMKRNLARYVKDQEALQKFFIEAQMAGRQIRER